MTDLCQVAHYRDPERPRPVVPGSRLCTGCTHRLADQLRDIPFIYEDVLGQKVRGGTSQVSGTFDPPQVVTKEQIEARFIIHNTLVGWCRVVADGRQVNLPTADSIPAMVPFLQRHTLWLTAHEDADEYAESVDYATREARRVAYPSRPERTYIGDCPMHILDEDGLLTTCGERVYAYPNRPEVECAGCGTEQTVEEWQRLIVGRSGQMVTRSVLLALLSARYMTPVERSTLASWVHRERVAPVACVVVNRMHVYDFTAVTAYTDTVMRPVGRSA